MRPAMGPAQTRVRSSTRRPSSGPVVSDSRPIVGAGVVQSAAMSSAISASGPAGGSVGRAPWPLIEKGPRGKRSAGASAGSGDRQTQKSRARYCSSSSTSSIVGTGPIGENTARPNSVISSTVSCIRRSVRAASNSRLCTARAGSVAKRGSSNRCP